MTLRRYLSLGILTGAAFTIRAAPVVVPDTLPEVTVETDLSRRPAAFRRDGSVIIGGKAMAAQPSFMGSGDAVGILKSLPSVTTTAELQASLSVRGGNSGDNLFEADGVRIVNPMHMLGFYSAFNPAFYSGYLFRSDRIPACTANATGALVEATSFRDDTVTDLDGNLSVGLIESHAAVTVPVGNSSVSAGGRHSYLGLLFPDIIKMDQTVIKYGFSEANANWDWHPDSANTVRATVFYSTDRMKLDNDKAGRKGGEFGWRNIASGLSWKHNTLYTSLSVSNYHNTFDFAEGGRGVSLPSSMTQITALARMPLHDFNLAADFSYRNCSGQQNILENSDIDNPYRHALEGNLAADWRHRTGRLQIDAGIRLTVYHCSSYNTVVPQPRIAVSWLLDNCSLYASYNRRTMFDQLIEETTASLPADFRINCNRDIRPRDNHALGLGIHGYVNPAGIGYTAEVYWQRMLNVVEFDGSLIDLVNPGYNPAAHLTAGNGYSAGLTLSLTRSFGRLRGRAAYNLGIARLKNSRYGDRYYAAPHDRLHDLKTIISYDIVRNLTVSVSFTHATGTHYTRAKYGYMIGENIICEYFPHNSSRLPSYNRLDVSANWVFMKKGHFRHSLNLSVYNATAAHNVLFVYTSYSMDKGIRNLRSVMKSVIPSLSYAIEF